jgi:O-antigen ligase
LLLRGERLARPPTVVLALAGVALTATLLGFFPQPEADMQFVVASAGLWLGVLVAWPVFRAVPSNSVAYGLMIAGVVVSSGFIVFAVPMVLRAGGRNPWVTIYTNDLWVNPNTLGAFLALILSVIAGRTVSGVSRPRWILMAGLVVLAAIALTYSRSSYLAAVVVLVVALLRARIRWGAFVAGVLAVILLIDQAGTASRVAYTVVDGQLDPSSATRLDLWSNALPAMLSHPWGSGPVVIAVTTSNGTPFTYAHNLFLTVGLRFGLVAGALLVTLAIGLLAHTGRMRAASAANEVAFLATCAATVTSLFGEPYLLLTLSVPYVALLATMDSHRIDGSPDESPDSASRRNEPGRPLVPGPGNRAEGTRA